MGIGWKHSDHYETFFRDINKRLLSNIEKFSSLGFSFFVSFLLDHLVHAGAVFWGGQTRGQNGAQSKVGDTRQFETLHTSTQALYDQGKRES